MTVLNSYNPELFEEKCYIVEVNPFSNNKYTLSFNGDECWYDEKGYMTRYKRSDGYEIRFNDGLVEYIIDKVVTFFLQAFLRRGRRSRKDRRARWGMQNCHR